MIPILSTVSVHTGDLILVNAQFACRFEPAQSDLVEFQNDGVLLARTACEQLTALMDDIESWQQIGAVSGYRSEQEQREIYKNSLSENGPEFTESYVALPGHSEHQTGLAVDLCLKKSKPDFIRPDFPDMGICRTFRQNAASYGFIERYPKDKETITGISPEPWHFRYVGCPHAEIMQTMGLTLEEYHALLKQFPYDRRMSYKATSICFVAAQDRNKTELVPNEKARYSVSGNNADGYILTERGGANDEG